MLLVCFAALIKSSLKSYVPENTEKNISYNIKKTKQNKTQKTLSEFLVTVLLPITVFISSFYPYDLL